MINFIILFKKKSFVFHRNVEKYSNFELIILGFLKKKIIDERFHNCKMVRKIRHFTTLSYIFFNKKTEMYESNLINLFKKNRRTLYKDMKKCSNSKF